MDNEYVVSHFSGSLRSILSLGLLVFCSPIGLSKTLNATQYISGKKVPDDIPGVPDTSIHS